MEQDNVWNEESIESMFETNPDALSWKFEEKIKGIYWIYRKNLHDDSSDGAIYCAAEGIAHLNKQMQYLKEMEREAGMLLPEERGAIIIDHVRNLYKNILQ